MSMAVVLTTLAATAQTLNITVDNVTYQFPASQAGEMTFSDGTTLTVMGKAFTISDITSMYTDETSVTDFQVGVVYSTSGDAQVTIPGNVAQYVSATVSGNTVTLTQSSDYAGTDYNGTSDEITYQLSGESSNGSLTLGGSYKCTISLAGVTLTNPSGAAIYVTNSKRIQLSAKKDTENTITDGTSGSQKAAIYSKGQLQLQGNGTLNVVGNTKHGIKSASYISIKNLTLNITSAVSDGINCEEYLLIKSGTVTISGVGDDGIQCDLDEDKSNTGEITATTSVDAHEDENSGNIYLEGGTLNITVTAAAAKGIKADGDLRVSQADSSIDTALTIATSGDAAWDSSDSKVKACAGMSADGNMTVSGGTLTLTSSGSGGKGISVDGTLTISGGTITATTTGNIAYCQSTSSTTIKTTTSSETTKQLNDDLKTSPKAIKCDGAMTISGGTITATASYHEAIESKSTIDISGSSTIVYAQSGDDAINSASTFTISGGYVYAYSTGNDGLDANGNFYIKSGNIVAIGTGTAEKAIDANTEGGYKLYITGGNIVAVGGLENGSSLSGVSSSTASYSSNTWYTFKNGGTSVFSFQIPTVSSSGGGTGPGSGGGTGPGSGGGGWHAPGGQSGSSSSSMTIVATSTPSISSGSISGTTIWNGYGIQ